MRGQRFKFSLRHTAQHHRVKRIEGDQSAIQRVFGMREKFREIVQPKATQIEGIVDGARGAKGPVVEIGDDVVAKSGSENERVISRAARQPVIAQVASEDVIAGAAIKDVVLKIPDECIVA